MIRCVQSTFVYLVKNTPSHKALDVLKNYMMERVEEMAYFGIRSKVYDHNTYKPVLNFIEEFFELRDVSENDGLQLTLGKFSITTTTKNDKNY